MGTASFFAAPEYGGGGSARPRAVNPRTGKDQSWTRASSFADLLDNPHGLIKSRLRSMVLGLSMRPDLARMLLAGTPIEDKVKADEIIDQALGMTAPEAKANEGTAAHTVLVQSWLHQDEPVPEEFVPLVHAFARALKEHGLTPKAAEQRVLNLTHNSMGSFDWIFEEADGTLVIGDVKTGRLDLAKRKFAVQLENYDGADYVVHADGTVEPIPWSLAHTHAVLVHVDLENGNAVSVYRVDLNLGRYGAGLADQVRQWHKLDPLSPYVRPVVSVTSTVDRPPHGIQVPADTRDAQNVLRVDPPVAGGVSTTAEAAPPIPSPAAEPAPSKSAVPTVSPGTDAPSASPTESGDRFTELMDGFDKAGLQTLLKKRGWTDISHNRRWLARALVVIEQGWTDAKQIKTYAAAKDDWSPEQGYTEPAPEAEPTVNVPQHGVEAAGLSIEGAQVSTGPSTPTLLEAIAGANNVGAIEALRSDIVERRGDQAWSDEIVAATRKRVYDLGELPISTGAQGAIMVAIQNAANQEALKNLWVRTTIGGSVPERWTQAMTDLGTQRLAALAAALPPAPTNPFGD